MALLRILFLVCSPKKMAKHSKWFVSEPINRLLQLKNECKQISSKVGTNFNANGNRFSTTYSQFRRIFHIYILVHCPIRCHYYGFADRFFQRKCYPKCDSILVTFGGVCSSILYIYLNTSSFRMANTNMV